MHRFSISSFFQVHHFVFGLFFTLWGASCSSQTEAIWKLDTSSPISVLRFSNNNKKLLIGHSNGMVEIWDYEEKQESFVFPSGTSAIYDANWSPDDQKIIIGGNDHIARVFEFSPALRMTSFVNDVTAKRILKAFFSPNGTSIIMELDIPRLGNGTGPEVVIWNSNKMAGTSPSRLSCRFHPVLSQDGTQLLTINGTSMKECKSEGVAELYQLAANPKDSHFIMDSGQIFSHVIRSAFFLPKEKGIMVLAQDEKKQDILCPFYHSMKAMNEWMPDSFCIKILNIQSEIQFSTDHQQALLLLKNGSDDIRLRFVSDVGKSLSQGVWIGNLSTNGYPLLSPNGKRVVVTRKIIGEKAPFQTAFVDSETGKSLFLMGTSYRDDASISRFSNNGDRLAMTVGESSILIWDTTGM